MNGLRWHTFKLLLERPPTDAQLDELADVCADAGFTGCPDGTALAEFDTASSYDILDAIAYAIADAHQVGLVVTGVAPVTRVMNQHVADRVGWTQEQIVEWVWQSRAVHSKPLMRNDYMEWSEVRAWLAAHKVPCAYDWEIESADRAYRSLDPLGRRWLSSDEMASRFRRFYIRLVNSPWDPASTHQLTIHHNEASDRWEGLCSSHRMVFQAVDGTADGHDETVHALCEHDRIDHGGNGVVDPGLLLAPDAIPSARRTTGESSHGTA
jgi:hypothetical protein